MAGPEAVALGGRRRRLVALALTAALYLLAVAFIVFWPVPVDRPAQDALPRLLESWHAAGVPAWVDYQLIEWLANVVMFLPWGVLGTLLLPRRRWWVVPFSGLLASAAVESAQYIFLPARFASSADIVANTAGAVLGFVATALVIFCFRRWRKR
ncbi:MAG: VanZ family protein [Arthrobacter sp.]|uniref:VanZ family protein n=1 Tax=Arthrobacter sp. 179 TaxID=3457734 RepID=UPI00264F2237|nr:VanZ family protein [Micrococcaceae bacterium]MDN5879511.1 VanZ family protein [Micrococcaceae bacterium]MDN5887865.1 VanZ family protein [Micrococcaceae bacterium]MDN6178431.1 VanZ family protein [Micrococcaceae bacterium]